MNNLKYNLIYSELVEVPHMSVFPVQFCRYTRPNAEND